MTPCILYSSLLCLPHPVLDLGESLLDGIEVGRIGRQEPEPGSCLPDEAPDEWRFVAAEIVHDDDVSRLQRRNELLFDIGLEASAIDRPVEDTGRNKSVAAQCPDKSQRAPMAVRGKADQAFALLCPAPQRRRVGLDPGLVDEDQPPGIEPGLPGLPSLALPGDVAAGLLKREQCFF